MEQEPVAGSAGEAMAFGLINQANVLSKSARETQQALADQIEELTQLKQWAANAAVELQKRAEGSAVALKREAQAVVKSLEAERSQLHGVQTNLAINAMQAIQDAVGRQSDKIEQQVRSALAQPLHDIQESAAQVRQNIKDTNWMMFSLVFSMGIAFGLFGGYSMVMRTQNKMNDRLGGIEQFVSAPAQTIPAAPGQPASARKGKGR